MDVFHPQLSDSAPRVGPPSSVNSTHRCKREDPLSQAGCISQVGPSASNTWLYGGRKSWHQNIWTQMPALSLTSYIGSTKSFTLRSLRLPISEMERTGPTSELLLRSSQMKSIPTGCYQEEAGHGEPPARGQVLHECLLVLHLHTGHHALIKGPENHSYDRDTGHLV